MSLPYFNLANLYAIAIPWAPPPTMTILASLGKLARFGSMLLPNLSFDLKMIDIQLKQVHVICSQAIKISEI